MTPASRWDAPALEADGRGFPSAARLAWGGARTGREPGERTSAANGTGQSGLPLGTGAELHEGVDTRPVPFRARPLAACVAAGLLLLTFVGTRVARAEPPCPAPAPAPRPEPAAKQPVVPPPTGFESSVLSTSDVIVLGTAKLVGKATVKGTTVARVEVERVLKGTAERSFTLFVVGFRNTDDATAPFAPYVDENAHRSVLFLRETPNGSGLALVTLFRAEDFEGREKLDVLEKELAIAALPDVPERGRRSVAWFLELVGGERPWSRTHGVRELDSLSRKAPASFDDLALARLDTVKRTMPGRSERAVLAATLDRLDPDGARRERGAKAALASPAEGARGDEPSAPTDLTGTPRYRRAKARLASATDDAGRAASLSDLASIGGEAAAPDLLDAFRTGAPLVRERAAVLLGDLGVESAWTTLRLAYEAEAEATVREAIVRAAGYLGGASDVVWVSTHATGDALRRARCFAYARIRTPAALLALASEAEAARSATPPDEATGTLVDYLSGPAFAKTDPALKLRARRASAPDAAPRPSR